MDRLKGYIELINDAVKQVLKDRYIGVYIHGSVAEGTFKWDRSDVDVLVMMSGGLNSNEKISLLNLFKELESEGAEKGLEISILNKEILETADYPLPYEFHYSPYWYESVMSDGWENLNPELLKDEDLSSHIFNLHQNHIVVEGPPVSEVFPKISENDFMKSIEYDQYDTAVTSVDTVMNLCRFDYFVNTGRLVSKSEGLKHVLRRSKAYNEFLKVVECLYNHNKRYLPAEYLEEASQFRQDIKHKKEI